MSTNTDEDNTLEKSLREEREREAQKFKINQQEIKEAQNHQEPENSNFNPKDKESLKVPLEDHKEIKPLNNISQGAVAKTEHIQYEELPQLEPKGVQPNNYKEEVPTSSPHQDQNQDNEFKKSQSSDKLPPHPDDEDLNPNNYKKVHNLNIAHDAESGSSNPGKDYKTIEGKEPKNENVKQMVNKIKNALQEGGYNNITRKDSLPNTPKNKLNNKEGPGIG